MSDIMRMDRQSSQGYASVSRSASTTTTQTGSVVSEYSEVGEESKALKFSTKPKSQNIREGDVARFTCAVSGTCPIDVYWFKEGVDDAEALETNDKYEVSSEDNQHTLEIFFTTAEDNGQYLCLAKSDIASSHWPFGLTVGESISDQKPPLFLKELYDIEASEGDTVKFRCKVRAYPPPRVIWYKDGDRIETSQQYKLEKFGNRDYVLTISGVTPDQDAEFTVLAKNGAGEAKSSAQLLVEPVECADKPYSRRRDTARNNVSESHVRRQRNYALAYEAEDEVIISKPAGRVRKPLSSLQSNSLNVSTIHHSTSPPVKENSEKIISQISPTTPIAKKDPSVNESKTSAEGMASPFNEQHEPLGDTVVGANISTNEAVVAPSSSLRAAIRKDFTTSLLVEADNTVSITPEQNTTPRKQQPETVTSDHPRHSSVIELKNVNHIPNSKVSATAPSSGTNTSAVSKKQSGDDTPKSSATSMESEDSVTISGSDQSLKNSFTPHKNPSALNQQGGNQTLPEPLSETTKVAGVDIQPGFVREKQFQQFGDKITPAKTPAKHRKGAAPTPPVKVPETIELKGSSQQEDLPSSRSEWSSFFPSVKQRRKSFASENSLTTTENLPTSEQMTTAENLSTSEQMTTAETAPAERNNISSELKPKRKGQAPAPPSAESAEPAKKKTVKKIVKRTVSVKRTTCRTPVSSTDFGEGPPSDGCDYIKVCGKWVKMRAKVQAEEDAENIPMSRSEWGENIDVGQTMKAFKKSQEAKGVVITGRSLGPITKV